MYKKGFQLAFCSGMLFTPSVYASLSDCNYDADKQGKLIAEGSCKVSRTWFVGGDLGQAKTHISAENLEQFFQLSALNAEVVSIDKSDAAYQVYAGYQFYDAFALQAGYIDLGERSARFLGNTQDQSAFFDNLEHVYPESGAGAFIAAIGTYSISDEVKLSGKLGYLSWKADYVTNTLQNNVGMDKHSGNDLFLGAELGYQWSESWVLYGAYHRFKFDRDTNSMLSFGARYYFANSPQTVAAKPAATPAPKPVPAVAKKVELDTDADGVLDKYDDCPNSEIQYLVDNKGCTILAEQFVSYKLTLNYANDSAEIAESYHSKIAELAEFIRKYNVKKLVVYGHTSAPGSKAYNQKLSEKRAISLAKVLDKRFGINPSIIVPVGKGEMELLDVSGSQAAHDKNRRIELAIEERLIVPKLKQAQ